MHAPSVSLCVFVSEGVLVCVCVCGAVLWPVIQDPVFVSHSDKQLPEAQEIKIGRAHV